MRVCVLKTFLVLYFETKKTDKKILKKYFSG